MGTFSRSIPISGKSAQEIYDKISSDIDKLGAMDTSKFGKFDFERDPAAKKVHMKSSMGTASLQVKDGEVVLEAKLGLLASAFKGKIEEGIQKWMKKSFPTA